MIWTAARWIDGKEKHMNEENKPVLPQEENDVPAEPAAEKPDLFDYLESLPDVEDPFEPSEDAEPEEEPHR